jgi:hypothetical protein
MHSSFAAWMRGLSVCNLVAIACFQLPAPAPKKFPLRAEMSASLSSLAQTLLDSASDPLARLQLNKKASTRLANPSRGDRGRNWLIALGVPAFDHSSNCAIKLVD